jgi:plastocyanin
VAVAPFDTPNASLEAVMKLSWRTVAIVVGVLASTGCTSSEDTGAPTDSAAAEIQITSNQFSPAQVTIKVNDVVRWNWAGGTHNVVSGSNCSRDGNFASGAPVSGGSFEQKFDKAGTYPYFCELHCSGGMTGEIIVE